MLSEQKILKMAQGAVGRKLSQDEVAFIKQSGLQAYIGEIMKMEEMKDVTMNFLGAFFSDEEHFKLLLKKEKDVNIVVAVCTHILALCNASLLKMEESKKK